MSDAMAITDARDLSQGAGAKPASTNAVEVKNQATLLQLMQSHNTFKPAIKACASRLVGLFGLLLFVVIYLTLSTPESRPLYPSMSEEDRSEAFALLQSNGMSVSIDQ